MVDPVDGEGRHKPVGHLADLARVRAQAHLIETWKLGANPQFIEKVRDVVGLHLILDNYAAHKTPEVKRWLLRHARFHLYFTPTSSSWLNLVERWFAELTRRKLRRSAHRSVVDLEADLRQWTNAWRSACARHSWPVPTSRGEPARRFPAAG